jgi:hypothetical protein
MSTFTIYSAGCPICKSSVETLKAAEAQQGCGCQIEVIDCDGHCDAAKQHGFEGKDRPIILRDGAVVHEGALSAQEAEALLPA